jgi:hypothetical protein
LILNVQNEFHERSCREGHHLGLSQGLDPRNPGTAKKDWRHLCCGLTCNPMVRPVLRKRLLLNTLELSATIATRVEKEEGELL